MSFRLTEDDYNALYQAVKKQIPRVPQSMFPAILTQLVDQGVLEMKVTDEEIILRMPKAPGLGVYRVERKRMLH